jgi:hypothetical protein
MTFTKVINKIYYICNQIVTMAKINNKTVYPLDLNLSMEDYVIGSNNETENKKTQNFPLGSIFALFYNFLGFNSFIYIDDSVTYPIGSRGCFYAYDEDNAFTTEFNEAKKLLFSSNDTYNINVVNYIKTIVDSGKFLFKLSSLEDKNSFVFFSTSNFVLGSSGTTFTIDVALVDGLSSGSFVNYKKYLLAIDYYAEEIDPIFTQWLEDAQQKITLPIEDQDTFLIKRGDAYFSVGVKNILSNSSPIPAMELRIIARGATNTTDTDQAGDIVEGWGFWDAATNTGVYWLRAIWNGGNRSDRTNYTVLQYIEI